MKLGLVLAGGGARGAYQIEVWKALAKLKIDKGCIRNIYRGVKYNIIFTGRYKVSRRNLV